MGKASSAKKGPYEDLASAAKRGAGAIGIPTSLDKFIDAGKEILKLTTEFDGLGNAIKLASANSINAQANIDYIGNAITRLHG